MTVLASLAPLAGELAPFVALGLFGSLHCAGMCGGFAVAVTTAGSDRSRAMARRQAGYILGKASTYAMLGLVLSSGFGSLAHTRAATAAAWIASGVLLLLGLRWLGLTPRARAPRIWNAPPVRRAIEALRALHGELVRIPGFAGAFGAGAVNGLVPCGLSFGAFALAAASSPTVALVGPFVFGLATAPALVLVGAGAWLLRQARLPRTAAVVPVAIGLTLVAGAILTAWRGAPLHRAGHAAPNCCEQAPALRPTSAPPVEVSDAQSP